MNIGTMASAADTAMAGRRMMKSHSAPVCSHPARLSGVLAFFSSVPSGPATSEGPLVKNAFAGLASFRYASQNAVVAGRIRS